MLQGTAGIPMKCHFLSLSLLTVLSTLAAEAGAVASAELYQNQTYTYGRFEARIRFAPGDGIISSFFLWKPGSEMAGTFWNELDFEKLGPDCRLQTNPLYGLPVVDHHQFATLEADLCGEYHTYTFEWTPSYIAYLVDGVELRRDGEETAAAFSENAATGMQMHFNIWPGDASFGGNFDPASLPVQQYISWVQYSSFANGTFSVQWREEFDEASLPSGWSVGSWASPKNLSTHQPANVGLNAGFAVLSLTADAATGFAGTPPPDPGGGSTVTPGTNAGGAAGTNAGGAAGTNAAGATGTNAGGNAALGAGSGGADNSGAPNGVNAAGASGNAAAGMAPGNATGPSTAPSDAPRASSRDGGCSQSVHGSSDRLAWLAIGGTLLIACSRRLRRSQRERPQAAG